MFAYREFRRPVALAALLLAGFVLSSNTESQGAKKKATRITNAQLLTQLDDINASLRKANHNYGRHRVKSMQEINKALSVLGVKTLNTDFGETAKAEDKAVSDAQLTKAQADLKAIVKRLGKPKAKSPRARIVGYLNKSIDELGLALKFAAGG